MIFIWIPKTGGTTYSHSVVPEMQVITENYEVYDPDRNIQRIDWNRNANITFGHASPAALLAGKIIPEYVWNNHMKLALVRNPYDRFVSLYHDYQRTGRIPRDFTQLQFIRAISEIKPVPGLYNSNHLSMCAAQIWWLMPGIVCSRFEDVMPTMREHMNSGLYKGGLDPEAKESVKDYYRVDFIALNYRM